jgi:hypothetical protein
MDSRPGSYSGIEQIVRQSTELAKKLRDAEARLAASSNDYEQDHSDLEARLGEVSLLFGLPLARSLATSFAESE